MSGISLLCLLLCQMIQYLKQLPAITEIDASVSRCHQVHRRQLLKLSESLQILLAVVVGASGPANFRLKLICRITCFQYKNIACE